MYLEQLRDAYLIKLLGPLATILPIYILSSEWFQKSGWQEHHKFGEFKSIYLGLPLGYLPD